MDTANRVQRAVAVVTGVTLAFLCGLSVLAYVSRVRSIDAGSWVAHTHEVEMELETLRAAVLDRESSQRGYVITGDPTYVEGYLAKRAAIRERIDHIELLTSDNPRQQIVFPQLRDAVNRRLAAFDEYNAQHPPAAVATSQLSNAAGRTEMNRVLSIIGDMMTEESRLLGLRDVANENESRAFDRTLYGLAVAGLGAVLGSLLLLLGEIRKRFAVEVERERFFALSPSLMCTVGSDKYFKRINPAFAILGYSEAELLSRSTTEFIHPDDLAASGNARERMAAGENLNQFESRYRCKDGSYKWFLWSTTSYMDGVSYVAGHDITERKENALRTDALTKQLARSNRELQDFASVASHDLQEPLRKIRTFGDRARSKLTDDTAADARAYVEKMNGAAARMQQLIENLLSYSRVSSRAEPFVRVDLNVIAKEVLSDLETRIESAGARIDLTSLPVVVGDPMQLRQLLQNLIGNALKFSREGVPPVVTIKGEGDALVVKDNGIGFEPQYAERIFGIFQRLHGRNEYEGTGIGLSICRKIVEHHRGTIEAAGVPGEGASFVITFPAPTGGGK